MGMDYIENKIRLINEQILILEKNEDEKILINEMKKIGIEKLPYSFSSLKKFIDSDTMKFHYSKHYIGYVDKLNSALSKKKYGDLELEDIIKSISKYDETIRNNAGGAFNHALFWKMLTPKQQSPKDPILKKIKSNFGSFVKFKKKFEEVAKERFGSGWVWLILTKSNRLRIVSTPNQDNPLMNIVENGGYPLLGLDLWEHAYYLKYKNKRDEYIKNFWKCVNWEFVNELYLMKQTTKLNENMVSKPLLLESQSEGCTREEREIIRFIFNINPQVKYIYKNKIESVLIDVFKEYHYENDEYGQGHLKGIYDFEKPGRSVLNKLNTNYSCFCLLLKDINKVLKHLGRENIKLSGQTPKEQIEQTKRFIEFIEEFKDRIFKKNSPTFQNIMKVLGVMDSWGQKTEDETIKILKKKFGENNVIAVGSLGSKSDMLGGIDCIIIIDGVKRTCQIKPISSFTEIGDELVIFGSANVKKYNTDLLIFNQNNKEIFIFNNDNTKIVNGNYVFPKKDLIYSLS
jgi:Fe-Mn family superoxide dismutase